MFVFSVIILAGSRQNETTSSHSRFYQDFPQVIRNIEMGNKCVLGMGGHGYSGQNDSGPGFHSGHFVHMRGLPFRATEGDVAKVSDASIKALHSHGSCAFKRVHSVPVSRCVLSSSLRWIHCESTLILLPMASRPEKQMWSSAHMKMQWQPWPKTRTTCVCPRTNQTQSEKLVVWSSRNLFHKKWSLKVHFSSTEHRYIELFLNSTSSGAAELGEFLFVLWLHRKACIIVWSGGHVICCRTDQMRFLFPSGRGGGNYYSNSGGGSGSRSSGLRSSYWFVFPVHPDACFWFIVGHIFMIIIFKSRLNVKFFVFFFT